MKQRRVMVTLELDTCERLSALRSSWWWDGTLNLYETKVLQAQANVIRKKQRKSARTT